MITPVLHCPYGHGTEIVRHGLSPEGQQRSRCRACLEGRGRPFLLAYASTGPSSAVKQQIVERALNARGMRDPARVLHVSPTTVRKEFKKRRLPCTRCITPGCSASPPSRVRWRAGGRMRWRDVVASAPSSTQCGAPYAAKRIHAGYGLP